MVQQGMVALWRAPKLWGSSCLRRASLLPSMYNFSRAFSAKLFVGGLSYHTNEEMLRKAFSEHGDVVDVKIINDRESGRSRGFGFVTFSSEAEAEAAKTKMAGHLLDGRFIRVDMASSRPPASSPFSNSSSCSGNASPSGFSFGTRGSRPPVVEDWGPLPSYSAQVSQATSTTVAYQGSPASSIEKHNQVEACSVSSSNQPSPTSTLSFDATSRYESHQQSWSSSDTSSFQSSTSVESITAGTASVDNQNMGSNAASVSANHSTTSPLGTIGTRLPDVPSTQGVNSTRPAVSSLNVPSSHSFNSTSPAVSPSDSGLGPNRLPSWSSWPASVQSGSSEKQGDNASGIKPKRTVVSDGSCKVDEFTNWQSKVTEGTWQSKLTEEAIPPPKGPVFDFGLAEIPESPPPLEEGANPHGGFNPSVCLEGLGEAEPVRLPYSIFTARTLPPLDLPWLTPEADNWSEIGKPPRRIEDSPYSPFSPDLKDDPEFWWDPYDFDEEGKAIKEAFPDVQPEIKDEPIELKLFKDRQQPAEPAAAAANSAS